MADPSEGAVTIRGGLLAISDPQDAPRAALLGTVRLVPGDLQIVDGVITLFGVVPHDRGEVVDASNLIVMPGVIDAQVHFREPGFPEKEDIHSGSRAAAAGGVTAFCEMPNTKPPTVTREALEWKLRRAAETSLVHFGFFIGATVDNLEELLACESRTDVAGIKIFMGSSTGSLLVAERADLERIFASGRRLIAVHAEDEARLVSRMAHAISNDVRSHPDIRDAMTAKIATALALELSEKYRRRLHILHVSTADEVELLREKKPSANGRITAEVTPQHLLLKAPDAYERLGTRAQMNPPIRDRAHQQALWQGLREGAIDFIATDHAPHTLVEKALPYGRAPSGMPGVETALALMLDAAHRQCCSIEEVVSWMSARPSLCYRIENKGRIEVGMDGDVVLVDPKLRRRLGRIRSRCGWNPFEDVELTGWPVATFVRGTCVYRDGEIIEASAARPLRFSA